MAGFRLERRRGQAIVELAITLPILMLIVLGMVNLGLLIHAHLTLTQAAWEGARAGATIVDPSRGDMEIIGAVQGSLYGIDPSRVNIDIDPTQSGFPRNRPWPLPRGYPISVTLELPFTLYLPGSVEVRLTARAISRMEYQNP